MTNERFVALLEFAANNLAIEDHPRSYSGRAMYGRSCVGLVIDHVADVAAIGAEMMLELANNGDVDEDGEALVLLLKDARSDNMGRSQIVYWPKVKWEGDVAAGIDEDDEEDDDDNED